MFQRTDWMRRFASVLVYRENEKLASLILSMRQMDNNTTNHANALFRLRFECYLESPQQQTGQKTTEKVVGVLLHY